MTYGQRLKQMREAKGWKRVELAKKAGINPQSISDYEKEKFVPTLSTAVLIAQALDSSLDYMFLGKEPCSCTSTN